MTIVTLHGQTNTGNSGCYGSKTTSPTIACGHTNMMPTQFWLAGPQDDLGVYATRFLSKLLSRRLTNPFYLNVEDDLVIIDTRRLVSGKGTRPLGNSVEFHRCHHPKRILRLVPLLSTSMMPFRVESSRSCLQFY